MKPQKRINRARNAGELLMLLLSDALSLLGVFWLSLLLRTDVLPLFYPGFPADAPFRNPANLWWVLLTWIFFYWYEGLYTKRFSLWDEIEALVKVAFFSTAAIFTIISVGKLSEQVSRTLVVLMGMVSVFLLPAVRVLVKRILRSMGFLRRRVLILGATDAGRRIATALKKEPHYGYTVVGFLDDQPEAVGTRIDGVKVHRGIDRALAYVRRANITDLFIAVPDEEKDRVRSLINALQHQVDRVLFVPDMFGIAVLGTSVVHFFQEQAFAFEIQNNLAKPFNFLLKRCFDLVLSACLLVILAIPLLVLALIIRRDSPGPAIFRQQRVGQGGALFDCFKFRTMYADAEARLARILQSDPAAREEYERHWKLKDDPRVTRVGHLLRKTSLDELPQLLNVLKGEMSIIGARPYIPSELPLLGDRRDTILLTKPGITGLWQVSGRSTTQYELRVALDSWYVQNWNLWLDIVILFKTLLVVLRRQGAY